MQTENENKVVPLFGESNKAEQAPKKKEKAKESFDFESIMKKNTDNSGRQAQERNKANKGVIRSFRLKH